jgi:hypothetical protein
MARAIADNLKPGGRFVTTNSHLCDHPGADYRPYSMATEVPGPLLDGAPYDITFLLDGDDFTIVNYAFSRETYESALHDAGLSDIRWYPPTISEAGVAAFPAGYWDIYLSTPPLLRLTALKRST